MLLLPLVAPAQGDAPLCIAGPNPEIAKFKVHWESFDQASMREQTFVERDYQHTVEDKAYVITALRDDRPVKRPCNWIKAKGVQVRANEGAQEPEPWGEAITLIDVLTY